MSTKSRAESEERDPADFEYDFRGGVRGQYYGRTTASGITVRIDPDVAQVFPNADAVNAALRRLIQQPRERAREKPR
ncbi:MAG: hypothetical protein IT177_23900 [Acidobacteria bacterium]|nr:hypothetical protein [Acidobacteriota bacterium]